ncbi:hypothetical protein ACTID9_07530 [Brevibacillus fluminis]|uniref:hypothetical protein n=1 Tax=Brevibacillus fluminis TaxID=511487 RepID=UPI003F8C7A1C
MLHIHVLVKWLYDPSSIQWNDFKNRFDCETLAINKADLHALQWACDYKRKNRAHITVLMVVEKGRTVPVERLEKYPIDQMILIETDQDRDNPFAVAALLAEEIKTLPYDLLINGSESGDYRTGITPIAVAERLQIPCLTHVHQMEQQGGGKWICQRKEGRGMVRSFEVALPALIGVVPAITPLRYIPSHLGKGKKAVLSHKVAAAPALASPPPYERVKLTAPQPVIHSLDVPRSPLAQHRILAVSGISNEKKDAGDKKKSASSPEFAHSVKEKIQSWLKE